MSFTISEKILNQTVKCEFGFSCLKSRKNEDKPMCDVDYANGQNVLFLKNDDSISCPYQTPYGYGMVCTCPTHFAIHKIYGTQAISPSEQD